MRIANLRVVNFRCLAKLNVRFDQLTILMGRNGSGKSSILNALRTFFMPNATITKEDYFNGNLDEPIEIELQFTDFTSDEANDLACYIQNGTMTVTKHISFNNETDRFTQEYFASSAQIPEFATIRQIDGARNKINKFNEITSQFPGLERGKSETQVLDQMANYEKQHPELTKLLESRGTFFGAHNVGGGKLDNYTKLVFLPAVKEATDEVDGKNSSINKLLDILVMQKIKNRDDLIQFKKDMQEKITEKYSPKNLGGLEELSQRITQTLNRYAPGSSVELQWSKVQQPEIALPSVLTNVFEDEYGGNIVNKGHGLQRALILTVLEQLATTIIKDQYSEETQETNEKEKTHRIDTIIAIEEPELYLHPSRAKYLSKILAQLANPENNTKTAHMQIIYTTHSPYFVGLDRFDSMRVCRKIKDSIEIPHTEINFTDLKSTAQKFEQLNDRSVQYRDINQNFKVRSANAITTTINEGFFADFVVFTEGVSDSAAILKVQEIKNKEWDKYAIAVIPVYGKINLIRIKVIFDALKIPNYTIFDKDENSKVNEKIFRLLNVDVKYPPTDKIQDTWAYNDRDLEDEIKKALTAPVYEQIWADVKNEIECRDNGINKNADAVSRFVEIAYEKKHTLKHLEDIIEKIGKGV